MEIQELVNEFHQSFEAEEKTADATDCIFFMGCADASLMVDDEGDILEKSKNIGAVCGSGVAILKSLGSAAMRHPMVHALIMTCADMLKNGEFEKNSKS